MPNIIEQQDLLKGLPDNRLAMMMQNPTGDIPPFLVAAEAQRRQAIRQQFSGGPQESVVDTLTKQLANVPQNIQAPAQQPPQLPPPQMPPQMAGVAALQQQMPQQQMQQAPEQAMRDGGMVQRYDVGGRVEPLWSFPSYPNIIPRVVDYVGAGLGNLYNIGTTSYSDMPAAEEVAAEEDRVVKTPFPYGMTRGERQMMPSAPEFAPIIAPLAEDPGKKNTSIENQKKISYEEYKKALEGISGVNAEDSEYIKGKLEELYGYEPSSWEKSQKWFQAAQAAMEPGQSNWQAAVNALSALGGGMADERASERENQQALAEALLRYEMGDIKDRRQYDREVAEKLLEFRIAEQSSQEAREAAAAERERETLLKTTEQNTRVADMYLNAANRAEDDLRRTIDRLTKDGHMTPEAAMENPEVIRLQEKMREYYRLHTDALRAASFGTRQYGKTAGVSLAYEEADGVNPIRRNP